MGLRSRRCRGRSTVRGGGLDLGKGRGGKGKEEGRARREKEGQYLKETHSSVQGQRRRAAHIGPARHVVAAPGAGRVAHCACSRATGQDERALVWIRVDKGVVRGFGHELGLHAAAPEPDLLLAVAAFYDCGIFCIAGTYGVVVCDGVLVVVVPDAVDADFSQSFDAFVPPPEASRGCEVDVAPLAAFSTACAPQPRHGRLPRVRIREECFLFLQLLVRRMVRQQVRLNIRDQANTSCMIPFHKSLRIRKAMLIPREHIPGLRLRLRNCVTRTHLERRARDIMLLQLLRELLQRLARPRLVQHRVLHPARNIPKRPARHKPRIPDQICIEAHHIPQRPANKKVLLQPAVILTVDFVLAPEAVDLRPNTPRAAAVGGGEAGCAAGGRGVDEQRDVLVERVRAVDVVAEGVAGGEDEVAVGEVHRGGFFAEADVERVLCVLAVVRDAAGVEGIGAVLQVAVQPC